MGWTYRRRLERPQWCLCLGIIWKKFPQGLWLLQSRFEWMEMERRKMGAGWRTQLSLLFCTGSCCLIYYNNQETFFLVMDLEAKRSFSKESFWLSSFFLGILSSRFAHMCVKWDIVMLLIISLVGLVKGWKQPQYPLTGDCRNKSRDHIWWSIIKVEKRMSKHVMQL